MDFEETVRFSLRRAAGEGGSTATLRQELARRKFRPRGSRRLPAGTALLLVVGVATAVAVLTLR